MSSLPLLPSNADSLQPSDFWDALAPHHAAIEDNYLDRASLRLLVPEIQEPVLVVGAGQGLLVAELYKMGLRCDGVDFSPEMIHQARVRRGLNLIRANARSLPFADGSYQTVIFATGVIDFIGNEEEIRSILIEGRRVVRATGITFVAFYRLSNAIENFALRTGLLRDNVVYERESLENYLLTPPQALAWTARKAGVSRLKAAALLLRTWAFSTRQEKVMVARMQRMFRRMNEPSSLLKTAPEQQPYRNEPEIRKLFQRLKLPIRELRRFSSCKVVKL